MRSAARTVGTGRGRFVIEVGAGLFIRVLFRAYALIDPFQGQVSDLGIVLVLHDHVAVAADLTDQDLIVFEGDLPQVFIFRANEALVVAPAPEDGDSGVDVYSAAGGQCNWRHRYNEEE